MTALHRDSVLVSVVLPTYQRPTHLRRAIDSVVAQTYENWELIVVDDNDTGSDFRRETQELMEQYAHDPKIRYVQRKTNGGGGAARNTGIQSASGDYVAFLDDDDEWLASKLAEQVACFQSSPDIVGAVYTGTSVVNAENGRPYIASARYAGDLSPRILAGNLIGTTSTIMCRRSAFLEAGLFDERLAAAQDLDLYIRLAQRHHFACIDKPLVVRNKHGGARITSNLRNKVEAFEIIRRKYATSYSQHPKMHSRFLLNEAKLLMAEGDGRTSVKKLLHAMRLDPLNVSLLRYLLPALVGPAGYRAVQLSTRPLRLFVHRALRAIGAR